MFVSLELWLYLQPLSGLVAQKKLWMRFIWGLCFRFTQQFFESLTLVEHQNVKPFCNEDFTLDVVGRNGPGT